MAQDSLCRVVAIKLWAWCKIIRTGLIWNHCRTWGGQDVCRIISYLDLKTKKFLFLAWRQLKIHSNIQTPFCAALLAIQFLINVFTGLIYICCWRRMKWHSLCLQNHSRFLSKQVDAGLIKPSICSIVIIGVQLFPFNGRAAQKERIFKTSVLLQINYQSIQRGQRCAKPFSTLKWSWKRFC